MIIHSIMALQKLGGKIEDVTCKDLSDLSQDLYYLILQKLKEKALELEGKIDNWKRQEIPPTEKSQLNVMEKDLIKGRILRTKCYKLEKLIQYNIMMTLESV